MEGRAPLVLRKSAKQYDAAHNSARTRGSAVPSVLGSLFFRDLKNFVWWLCWNIVTVSTVVWGAQHCGQDGRDFLVIVEKCQQGTGESTLPRPHLPPSFAHEQDAVAQGAPLVSGFFLIALCEVFL